MREEGATKKKKIPQNPHAASELLPAHFPTPRERESERLEVLFPPKKQNKRPNTGEKMYSLIKI